MDQASTHEPNIEELGSAKQRLPRGARTIAGKRALVVANEKVSGEQLVGSVLGHLGPGVEDVFVVAPALADSALDHIMGDEDGAFAEKGLLEQAERDFDQPVLELVVSDEQEPRVLDVKSTKVVAGRRKGWRPSYNLPPLTRREIGGILVAIVGTIVLGMLASKGVADSHSNGNDHEEGRLGAEAAAAVLIALGFGALGEADRP